jgi:hypothetical protein
MREAITMVLLMFGSIALVVLLFVGLAKLAGAD